MIRPLKRSIERQLARALAGNRRLQHRAGRTVVLAYHNIVPAGTPPRGDASLHLPLDQFRAQLDLLQSCFTVLPGPALAGAGDTDTERPHVLLTIDDAYTGALAFGVPELVARGLPVTIFVAPALLGGRRFWWDLLAHGNALPCDIREHALSALGGDGERIEAWARHTRRPLASLSELYAGAELALLDSVLQKPGVTVGAHSWSHPNLAMVQGRALHEELQRPAEWLQARYGARYIPALAFPYGRFTEGTDAHAHAAGYATTWRVDGGWMPPKVTDRSHALPRFNVPAGLSLDGFRLRLAGLVAA